MRLSWSDINDFNNPFGGSVFRGEVSNTPWADWQSRLPDMVFLGKSVSADPQLAAQFSEFNEVYETVGDALQPMMQFVGDLVMADFIEGTRQTLGQLVQTVGIISNAFANVDRIFKADINSVLKGFDIAGMVLDSKIFEMALNALGAIPIVGWIIKIIYEVAKAVANIFIAVKDMKTADARYLMSKELTIPLDSIDFNPSTDDLQTKAFFSFVGTKDFSPNRVITPPYRMNPKKANFGFVAEGVYRDGDSRKNGIGAGWIVHGAESGTDNLGLGFVPGTTNMTRSFFFPAAASGGGCSGGGRIRDLGTLYPTASNLCTGWWSNVTKPGPSMFSVRPLALKNAWEDYIEQLFVLCENTLKGWTCAPTGDPFTDRFECYSGVYGMGSGDNECKKSRRGKTLRINKDFGRGVHTSFYAYLLQLFFGIENPFAASMGKLAQVPTTKSFDDPNAFYKNDLKRKFWKASAINYSKSVPVHSLDDLYARQTATLRSLQCMYVNGENPAHFPAFAQPGLRGKWADGVTDIFASGAWKHVVFADMPEGSAKNAFYEYAKKHKIQDVENFNRPCAPGEPLSSKCGANSRHMIAAASPIPEAPGLPSPPMNNVVLKSVLAADVGSGKLSNKKGKSKLPLVIAAGAIGLLIAKGR